MIKKSSFPSLNRSTQNLCWVSLWMILWATLTFLFLSTLVHGTTSPTDIKTETTDENKPVVNTTEKKSTIQAPLKPAYIKMQMGNGKIHIDGMVSSQEERDVLVKAVVNRIGESNVIDTLKISDKVSRADWISRITGLIDTMVEGVTLTVKDGDIQLTGNIDGTKARNKAVKQLTDTSAKSGLTISNKIDISSVSSVLNISKQTSSILLKGEIPSQAHIDTLIDASKKAFSSHNIINKLTVSEKALEPKWHQAVVQLIPELAKLKDSSLVINDQFLTLSGLFENEDAKTQLHGKVIKALNPEFRGSVAVKTLRLASFNLRMGNGMIHIDGTVSSEEERNTLLKSAANRVGSENVINTVKVSKKTTPANWIDEIAVLMESYIDGGWFSVKNKEVALMGSVDSTSMHQQTVNRFKLVLTNRDIKIIDHIKVNFADPEMAAIAKTAVNETVNKTINNTVSNTIPASEPEITAVTNQEPAQEIKQETIQEVTTETSTARGEPEPKPEVDSESNPVIITAQKTEPKLEPKPEPSENEKIKMVCQGMLDHTMKNNTIRFATNSAVIRVKSYPLLDNLSSVLKECEVVIADKGVTISGHTDSRGDAAYNMNLSQLRANSVEKYLRKADVHSTLITTIGYGEEQPVVPEDTAVNKAEARAQNRRITIQIKRKQE